MSWKNNYKRALINTIVRYGTPVDDKPNFHNWTAFDWQKRRAAVEEVGIDYDATPMPDDSAWDEFKGTFHEGDTRTYGIDVKLHLNDGRTMLWRIANNFSDLLKAVLEEADD